MNYAARARAALKMTQAEMANALGLTQSSVSKLEKANVLSKKDALAIRGLLAERKVRPPIPLSPPAQSAHTQKEV